MIISRTPFRISLFGGGTDYREWYQENGGTVIGTTINKYCYISIRSLPPFFEHRHRIVYSRIELPKTIEEIEHPAVRAVLQEHRVRDGVEVQHHGDLPARSGMGSSSSFTVGLLNAVRAFQGYMSSPQWLAREAIRIEQEVIREAVGSQDQVWAAYGGTNVISFQANGSIHVAPVIMSAERRQELESHMLLFFTGFSRIAGTIAAQKITNLRNCASQLRCMTQMALEAGNILQDRNRPLAQIGVMLNEAWRMKKELAACVSSTAVDEIYSAAIQAGALGAKLLGAGGGGFMLVFAEPARHDAIRAALKGLIEVSFQIGSAGSTIVIYEPDGLEEMRTVQATAGSGRSVAGSGE
jgi:D-glycero-alpha-D-manno-heptose-7-phosphate kinase